MFGCKIYKNDGTMIENTDLTFHQNSYIVESNSVIMGHFNVYYFGSDLSFEYELVRKFRGMGIGHSFFETVEDWIMNNLEFERILLYIRYDNEKSKKIVCKNNYSIDYNKVEEMDRYGEMPMYSPYVKVKKLV